MPSAITTLSRAAKVYIGLVVAGGLAALAHSAVSLGTNPARPEWTVLAGLTLLTGSLTIKVPAVSARLSVSEVFVFAAVLWFGPAVATLIVALDTLVGSLWLRRETRAPIRALFNISAGVFAIWVAAHLFMHTESIAGGEDRSIEGLLGPVLALAIGYFAINSLLVATALGLERQVSPMMLWRRNFLWLGLNHLVGASVAVLLVAYTPSVDVTALGVIVPLLAITYLTFKTLFGRLEDAHKHVAQLNDLYLSTIESLAMAVDAKDQITHGHIRRVQVYTLELATRLGVRDTQQLKAIEAAALLHDMGKLAIPEHILNKPGKLTSAEFDNMKRHADIGADLLSSIRFPYPVVPIVRHHHENWDGSGYPAGLAGLDIPIGARILSVVDCFDALTSDRPYRPRLTPHEAFAILQERKGRMYDPLVVDTFIAAYSEIAPLAILAGHQARSIAPAFDEQRGGGDSVDPLRNIRATAAQSSLLAEFTNSLQRSTHIDAAAELAAEYVRILTGATACAIFKHMTDADVLRCAISSGPNAESIRGLTIRRGDRVTGWVAANQRTIVNSRAELDLVEVCDLFSPPLNSAIASPIVTGTRLFGVLTAYASRPDAFSDVHRYAFERIASALGERIEILSKGQAIIRFPQTERI